MLSCFPFPLLFFLLDKSLQTNPELFGLLAPRELKHPTHPCDGILYYSNAFKRSSYLVIRYRKSSGYSKEGWGTAEMKGRALGEMGSEVWELGDRTRKDDNWGSG
jgi:hypothetical protein